MNEPVNKQLDTDRERIRELLAINGLPHNEIEGNMILALIASEKVKELEQIDIANKDNGINFYTSDTEVNNGWKTMRQYIKWRIKELKAQND